MSTPSRVAIVTGAASGIGFATAIALARKGFDLALAGRSASSLKEAARAIDPLTPRPSLVIPADIGIEHDAERIVERTLASLGRIDLIVNNAGMGDTVPIARTTPALVRRSIEVNALGPAVLILRAWHAFERQRAGCVVNVSSLATIDPLPGFFAYAASKAPVNLLTKSIASEGAAVGIRAFCIAPGAVETPLLRSMFDRSTVPESACLAPEDVAGLIVDCYEGHYHADNGSTLAIMKSGGSIKIWNADPPAPAREIIIGD